MVEPEEISPITYEEVYEILTSYAFVYDRVPNNIIRYIRRHADKKHTVSCPKGSNIFEYVSKDALELYTAIYLKYAASDKEKEEIKKVLVENEMKYQGTF